MAEPSPPYKNKSSYQLVGNLNRFIRDLGIKTIGAWIVYSVIVGVVGGLGAIIFGLLLTQITEVFLHNLCHFYPPVAGGEKSIMAPAGVPVNRLALFLIPALGGLISGLLVYSFAPEAEGHGTDAVVDAFHRHRGIIRKRVPIIKLLASSFTIGTGGSAGREGPIAQIGAGFASFFSSLLKLNDRERRILVLAGAGAGIGSIFRAPLGGAFFATEVLYSEPEFEYEALIPCFLSSIVGYSVYCTLSGYGWGAIFRAPAFTFHHPGQLIFYGLLGLMVAVFGYIYVKLFYNFRDRIFRPLKIPNVLKPAIGGLALGGIALFCPQVLGMGYGLIQQAMDGSLTLQFLFLVALLKIVATSFTIGSGGSGGVFAPSLVIGGLLGGGFGRLFNMAFPGIIEQPDAFVLVGMAGFFAGAAKVPIAAMIMVSEMTVGYSLLVPIMLVVALGFLLSESRVTIYERQVPARIDSPAHQGDFIIDILEMVTVKDVIRPERKVELIPEATTLDRIIRLIQESSQQVFPVIEEKGAMIGVLSLEDIRRVLLEEDLAKLVIAKDIAIVSFSPIYLEDNLNVALRKLISVNMDELPVVAEIDTSRVLAMLSRRDLIVAYNEQIQKTLATKA